MIITTLAALTSMFDRIGIFGIHSVSEIERKVRGLVSFVQVC